MKKIISCLLISVMLLSVSALSVSALTYGDLYYKVTNGEVTITDTEILISGDVVIPSYIDGNPVTTIGYAAFQATYTKIKSITLPDTLVSIKTYGFDGQYKIQTIFIPISVKIMGGEVFDNCDNLTTIYCEASSKPSGWSDAWLGNCQADVVWGYHTHDYGEWYVYQEATCEEDGEERRECSRCGEYESWPIYAQGHSSGAWITVTEPDIGKRGYAEKQCLNCGDVLDSKELYALDEFELGDVNADGVIDMFDYLMVKSFYFEVSRPLADEAYRADMNQDGVIDMFDYLMVKTAYFDS